MSALYRKKPVIIEAMLFKTNNDDGTCMREIADWINGHGASVVNNNTDLIILTLEGDMRASVGDYVIRGIKGEFYPCKPDIFEATYEPLETPKP